MIWFSPCLPVSALSGESSPVPSPGASHPSPVATPKRGSLGPLLGQSRGHSVPTNPPVVTIAPTKTSNGQWRADGRQVGNAVARIRVVIDESEMKHLFLSAVCFFFLLWEQMNGLPLCVILPSIKETVRAPVNMQLSKTAILPLPSSFIPSHLTFSFWCLPSSPPPQTTISSR